MSLRFIQEGVGHMHSLHLDKPQKTVHQWVFYVIKYSVALSFVVYILFGSFSIGVVAFKKFAAICQAAVII
jgi:hypothetical protein